MFFDALISINVGINKNTFIKFTCVRKWVLTTKSVITYCFYQPTCLL